ncbi:hypothetical protein B0H15DRAFT_947629 [Mycena belliarum]|uniref:Uncharacterized protein n=1 Tax=Mycena belliarum TaxID=1033014 RepID=A0AAD6UC74_9AGAR|nr:hypothetical protein B0H15DRAFT_947629 [Mycena belliae]
MEADEATVRRHKRLARKSSTRYRDSNRKKIRASDAERRAQKRLEQTAEEELTTQDPKGSGALDFGARAPRAKTDECREGCGEIACEGCACICTASSRWLEHQHYRTDAWHAAGCPA